MASELKAEPACVPFGGLELIAVGDSAREDSRLSRIGSSRMLLDEAWAGGLGRPSLLAEFLPKEVKPVLDGDGARLKPP